MTESTSTFEINVHYGVDGMFGANSTLDELCETILEEFGGERVASGSGFGGRDLHFAVPRGFNPQELRAIRERIRAAMNTEVEINCEEWPAPTEDDPEPFSISVYHDDPDEP